MSLKLRVSSMVSSCQPLSSAYMCCSLLHPIITIPTYLRDEKDLLPYTTVFIHEISTKFRDKGISAAAHYNLCCTGAPRSSRDGRDLPLHISYVLLLSVSYSGIAERKEQMGPCSGTEQLAAASVTTVTAPRPTGTVRLSGPQIPVGGYVTLPTQCVVDHIGRWAFIALNASPASH